MARYDDNGWDYYPPYVSVGEKKARGALALAKLLKKSKRTRRARGARPSQATALGHVLGPGVG